MGLTKKRAEAVSGVCREAKKLTLLLFSSPRFPIVPSAGVFWFGPYLGATAAALCYTYLFQHELFHSNTTKARKAAAATSGGAAPVKSVEIAAPEAVAVNAKGTDSDLQEWK